MGCIRGTMGSSRGPMGMHWRPLGSTGVIMGSTTTGIQLISLVVCLMKPVMGKTLH